MAAANIIAAVEPALAESAVPSASSCLETNASVTAQSNPQAFPSTEAIIMLPRYSEVTPEVSPAASAAAVEDVLSSEIVNQGAKFQNIRVTPNQGQRVTPCTHAARQGTQEVLPLAVKNIMPHLKKPLKVLLPLV